MSAIDGKAAQLMPDASLQQAPPNRCKPDLTRAKALLELRRRMLCVAERQMCAWPLQGDQACSSAVAHAAQAAEAAAVKADGGLTAVRAYHDAMCDGCRAVMTPAKL